MGNGVMASRPPATAPIFDSTICNLGRIQRVRPTPKADGLADATFPHEIVKGAPCERQRAIWREIRALDAVTAQAEANARCPA
jgi:hypothetical protein